MPGAPLVRGASHVSADEPFHAAPWVRLLREVGGDHGWWNLGSNADFVRNSDKGIRRCRRRRR